MNIVHQTGQQRFVYQENGHTAYLSYRISEKLHIFDHTIVPDALGGRGIGSALAHHAFAYAAQQAWTVKIECSFLEAFIRKHPEYRSVIA